MDTYTHTHTHLAEEVPCVGVMEPRAARIAGTSHKTWWRVRFPMLCAEACLQPPCCAQWQRGAASAALGISAIPASAKNTRAASWLKRRMASTIGC